MTTRREFLLLADTFDADKHDPTGMLMSEKLDGCRVWWDGGVTRGVPTADVPWASILNPKTGEPKDKIAPVATGLWSRYGNVINAPEWFLDALPVNFPLDGELYCGRGNFQQTMSAIRKDVPVDSEWGRVKFVAFAAPTFAQVFTTGQIKNANYLCEIDQQACCQFVADRVELTDRILMDQSPLTFMEELDALEEFVLHRNSLYLTMVSNEVCMSMAHLQDRVKEIAAFGGEGLMLRHPDSLWYPKRKNFILKVKPRHDSEATIVGFVAGRKGKTGQFLGKLGCLVVRWHGDPTAACGLLKKGVEFELGTGLTHADRVLFERDAQVARANPGKPLYDLVSATPVFKIGDRVTFSYRELSDDGVPKEASYLRKREDT